MSNTKEIRWKIFIVTIIGNFIAMLDSTTVNLALYPMSKALNVTLTQVQWVMLAYMLTLTVFLPFFGKLGDILPKNKLYSCGFAIFAIGGLCSYLSPNFGLLILSRASEAIGASIMLSNAQAIIATIFKNANRGKALGLNGCIIALGAMLGPAIGGLLINTFGWQSVFVPCIPIATAGAYYAWKILPSYYIKNKKFRFDYKGFIFFTISLLALLVAISQGYHWGWGSIRIIILGIASLIFGAMFYVRDKRIRHPLIDFSIFRIKAFTYGNLAVLTSYIAMFTNNVLVPFYLMEILKFNALKAGLLILPYSVTLIFTAPISGFMAGKYGSRYLTFIGPCVFMTSLMIISTFNTNTPLWEIIFASAILGIGNGLFQSPSNNAIMTSVQKKDLGIASGILALSRNMGHILGIAITITIFEESKKIFLETQQYTQAFLNAYQLTLLFGVFFSIICLLSAYTAYKPKRT